MNKIKIRIFIRPLGHSFDLYPYHWLEEDIYNKLLTKKYNVIIFYE